MEVVDLLDRHRIAVAITYTAASVIHAIARRTRPGRPVCDGSGHCPWRSKRDHHHGVHRAAAVGALVRAEVARRANWPGFPWGTFGVNVTGALRRGALRNVGPPALTVVGTAGLGACTTFSSFAAYSIRLAETRSIVRAGAYLAATVAAGVAAAALGHAIAI